jgi:hypothetical protein
MEVPHMMNEIELWEQEIETENKYQESIKEDTIYNFYDTGSSEVVQEGYLRNKLRKFFKKQQRTNTTSRTVSAPPPKREIDIEAFKKNYPKIMKIAKDSLKQVGNPKGFSLITSKEDNNYEEIVDGFQDYLCIIFIDIYEFIEKGENARDPEVNERLWAKYNELVEVLKKNGITEYGNIDFYGDWDDGPVALELN